MAFPQTRHSLIERLAGGGDEADWRDFLEDYWGPVCRFARQRANLTLEDAEDVASETLEAIVKNNLLSRWSTDRSAKLRTLICAVVRNVLSNRARVEVGRARIVREHAGELDRYAAADGVNPDDASTEATDAFYAAWADDLVQQAVDGLLAEYNAARNGDCFRILYGRLCEEMPMSEIAAALKLTPAAAESQFRKAKERLSERLQELVRGQVGRYSSPDEAEDEFVVEWSKLRNHLSEHGGLDAAIRRSSSQIPRG
jgi:RNA polymerase sigma factor (sigma-70 family)